MHKSFQDMRVGIERMVGQELILMYASSTQGSQDEGMHSFHGVLIAIKGSIYLDRVLSIRSVKNRVLIDFAVNSLSYSQ
jgi:hypothetical protein